MSEKPLIWLGDSRESIRAFTDDVRKIAGFQLWRVQRGLEPNDWKPMPSVGLGVQEIRIHTGALSIACSMLRSSPRQSTSCTRLRSERGGRRKTTSTSPGSACAC